MRKFLSSIVAAAAVVGFMCPAFAAPLSSTVFDKMGAGTAVACNVTPATVTDSTFTPQGSHWLIISNPSGNGTVYLGGVGVGSAGVILRPGDQIVLGVTKAAAVRCYASALTTINVVGAE